MVALLVPNGAAAIFDENAVPHPAWEPPGHPDEWDPGTQNKLTRKWEQWVETTFTPGTPVMTMRPEHASSSTWIPAGARGIVTDREKHYPPGSRDPSAHRGYMVPVRLTDVVDRKSGERLDELIGLERYYRWDMIHPLVDNWAAPPPAPTYSRYTLPRSQRYGLLKPNAAMDVRVGRELSEDERGTHARALGAGEKRYRVFHKKEPRRLVELPPHMRFPAATGLAGDCLSVSYRTDKWHQDGKDTDYKHVDEPGVKVYHQRGAYPWLSDTELPVEYPDVLVLLGKHLGYYVKRVDDGEIYEATPRGTYLFAAPSGKLLCVLHPKEGILALMAGGRLRVEADGIEG